MIFSSKQKEIELPKETEYDSAATEQPPPPYSKATHDGPSGLINSYHSAVPDLIAQPSKLFTIEAFGIGGWKSCGMDPRIPIYLGTDTQAQPLYISLRTSHKGNDCTLSHAEKGDVLTTAYRWGYGSSREPKIRWVAPQASNGECSGEDCSLAVTVKSSWMCFNTSVELSSTTDPSQGFKWKYLRTKTRDEGSKRVLALFAENLSSSEEKEESGPLAVLVRTASTRTPRTTRFHSGNGGQLLLSPNGTVHLDEAVIIASCIMMLKKEVERAQSSSVVVAAPAPS